MRLGCAWAALAAFTVFWHWEGGSTTQWHFGNWWGGLWLGPTLALILAWTLCRRRSLLTVVVPLALFAAAWILEVQVGRTVRCPWWATHVALAGSFLGLLGLGWSRGWSRSDLRHVHLLVAFAALSPWLRITPGSRFWMHCNRLRVGMNQEQVTEHMERYLLGASDEMQGRWTWAFPDPRPGARPAYIEFLHDEDVADVCYALFLDGKLRRLMLSPD